MTVSLSNYTKEVQYYKEKKERIKGTWPDVPIAMKEVSTVFGKCFFLSTEELATVEQKFQGKKNCTEWIMPHKKQCYDMLNYFFYKVGLLTCTPN